MFGEIETLARELRDHAVAENERHLARSLDAIVEGAARAQLPGANTSAAEAEIREAYRSLFRPKESGLGGFFRWDDDFATRERMNADVERVRGALNALLL